MTKLLALVAILPLLLAGCAGVGCVATDYLDGKGIGCGIYIEDVEDVKECDTAPPHKRLRRCPQLRTIDTIVLHCSATRPDQDIGVKQIDSWHRARGFASCGYHFAIRRSGELEYGRPISEPGAHARGYNRNSIGICLVGGLDDDGSPAPIYELAQVEELEDLLDALRRVLPDPPPWVIGHNELPGVAKACPSFDVPKWLHDGTMQLRG